MTINDAPLGVFDSGLGGLTVVRALRKRCPTESIVYLGDTARVPYGTKSAEVVVRYALRNAEFLLKQDIKLLVVACNTASAVAVPALRSALPVPVVGVIEPGALMAARGTRTGRIGVLGTPGTIASGAYERALAQARPGVFTWSRACPLFVPLAEEGWTEGDVPRLVAERYLEGLAEAKVDTLVLGCTHYPLLEKVIAQAAGPDVLLIDSGGATASVVDEMFRSGAVGVAPRGAAAGPTRYFVTDVPATFERVASRFLGAAVDSVEQVDISL